MKSTLHKIAMPRLVHPDAVRNSQAFQDSIIKDMNESPDEWAAGSSKVNDFFSNYIDNGAKLTAGSSIYNPIKKEYVKGSDLMKAIRRVQSKIQPVSRQQSKATAQHYNSFARGPLESYVQLINEGKHNFDPKLTVKHQDAIRNQVLRDMTTLGVGDADLAVADHDTQMDAVKNFMGADRSGLTEFDYGNSEYGAFDALVRKKNAPRNYDSMVIRPLQAIDRLTGAITDRLP